MPQPGRLDDPDGNGMSNGKMFGYLSRANALDSQGHLQHILFYNEFDLKAGDLVIFEDLVNPQNAEIEIKIKNQKIKGSTNIAIIISDDNNPDSKNDGYNKKDKWSSNFKEKWEKAWKGTSENKVRYDKLELISNDSEEEVLAYDTFDKAKSNRINN